MIDIQLGEIDGITFFRKVLADGFSIPAIFISGHATLSQAAEAVKSGAFDFIEKPFTAEKTGGHGTALPGDVSYQGTAAIGACAGWAVRHRGRVASDQTGDCGCAKVARTQLTC